MWLLQGLQQTLSNKAKAGRQRQLTENQSEARSDHLQLLSFTLWPKAVIPRIEEVMNINGFLPCSTMTKMFPKRSDADLHKTVYYLPFGGIKKHKGNQGLV